MHIQFIFRPLEDLEGSLMALYAWYADVFTLDAEARAMFTRLSGEEKSHMALVRYQKKLVTKNISLFGNVDVDLQDVRQMTAAAQRLTKATPRPSLGEAVTTALKFERSAGESHLRTAMKQANPDMGKLLTALCQGDKEHVAGLEAFAKKRGISTAGQPS